MPDTTDSPAVEVLRADRVDLVRGGRDLLRGVDLTVRAGEHWTLLGPNGAGKSTLLGLLGAVTHPTRGTVRVLGRQLGRVDVRALRAAIGHVNPRHPLQSPLTVREVVLTGVTSTIDLVPRWTPTTEQERDADELLDVLGIGAIRDARWPDLSQGERGRALIARALMPRPRLLLLDEPTTGLDVAAREQLLTGLDELRAEHPDLASVLVTHHLEEIPASSTHAVLLRDGEVVASGAIDEVLTTERVSACFGHPIRVARLDGRFVARAQPGRSLTDRRGR
ncbi:ATP-binding cassette domain-containing protein [Frankia sp. CNm7]|uniref:ATP-binding cassette domain-containing protein n=1 Tax=Frankia nepalensis TaxID=1836974 RepID=A0A937RJY5_9ACTN|nr:ATP-binding cassette domain-containing protein [Frankia nepalensis]MBL7495051.1 ATP-binding cassette domain-containing protein [Frankia nepalensis]MBL7510365.1 ATP-binding cassette domain-containing protein [Frankia nepalensis]MBL7520077.1 ATP-binding cassette domain-containing protein [Frankia nepalensis]MBL7633663.1 ATP-binding cassette domain-containing protein [Frankia nepalensis]